MCSERGTYRGTITIDQIENAGRNTGLTDNLGKKMR
jgi:hypothetical protein